MEAHRRLIPFALLLILAGCSAHNEAPLLQFLDLQTEDALSHAAEWGADERGVRLSLQIHALDKTTVFLFGDLATSGASIRSILLRSDDGGKSWEEIMTPAPGSQVSGMSFLSRRVGWVLVGWTAEGPGKLSLYATSDFGRSWRKVSNIPRRHYSGRVKDFGFLDAKNGRMEILYDSGGHTDGFVVMTTSNGGATWREVRTLSLDEYKERYGKDEEPEESPAAYVRGKDGSQWKLQKQSEEMIDVLRRLNPKRDWSVRSTIPARFQYSDGRVVIPGESE